MSRLLRHADGEDLAAIMRIERSVFAGDAWSAASMAQELASADTSYLVVVEEPAPASSTTGMPTSPDVASPGEVIAYAGVLVPRGAGQADVQTIAVAPSARGQGLGRALMQRLVEIARRRGAREVFLEVRADNPIAQALYRSLGFEEIGVRPRYYRGGIDAIVMRLVVTTPRAAPADAEAGTR